MLLSKAPVPQGAVCVSLSRDILYSNLPKNKKFAFLCLIIKKTLYFITLLQLFFVFVSRRMKKKRISILNLIQRQQFQRTENTEFII
jgi:hypothetical protein